ncbi:hypothetical protein LguiA_030304 [Lonicera macranthoides]
MNGDGLMEPERKQVFEEELELGSDIGSNSVGAAAQSDRITSMTGGTHFTKIGMVLWSCLYCRLKRNAEKWYTIIHGGLDRPDSPGHPSSSCLISGRPKCVNSRKTNQFWSANEQKIVKLEKITTYTSIIHLKFNVAMSLRKELIFLILQFCDDEDLKKTAHVLEEETSIFFNMMNFENLVIGGNWDEAERYLLGFIGIHNDKISIKIYFEIRKQKFLEALDHDDCVKALDILLKDLKVVASSNEELYKEMTLLLTLRDFR